MLLLLVVVDVVLVGGTILPVQEMMFSSQPGKEPRFIGGEVGDRLTSGLFGCPTILLL